MLYNRGVVNAMFSVEAIRTAMQKYGNKPLTGEQVRWGLEHLRVTDSHLKALGMADFTQPIEVTCSRHNGVGGRVYIQQCRITSYNVCYTKLLRAQGRGADAR